jgi:predicted transcriptional regulator
VPSEGLIMSAVKDIARDVVEHLSEDATWDDLEYSLYVRRKIARGEADIAAGRVVSHDDIKQRLAELLRR